MFKVNIHGIYSWQVESLSSDFENPTLNRSKIARPRRSYGRNQHFHGKPMNFYS